MCDVPRHYAERACPQTVRLMHQGLQCGAQASDLPEQKTHPLFSFEPMALNTVKNRSFTIQVTFYTIVQIGRVLKILD